MLIATLTVYFILFSKYYDFFLYDYFSIDFLHLLSKLIMRKRLSEFSGVLNTDKHFTIKKNTLS